MTLIVEIVMESCHPVVRTCKLYCHTGRYYLRRFQFPVKNGWNQHKSWLARTLSPLHQRTIHAEDIMARTELDWMRELQDVAGRFKDYFEHNTQRPEPPKSERPSHTAHDLYIEDSNVCVEVDLPGMKKDEIRITMAGDAIEVSGDRKPRRGETARVMSGNHKYGPFSYRIALPREAEIDASNASASYTDGVLKIVLPQTGKGLGFSIQVE